MATQISPVGETKLGAHIEVKGDITPIPDAAHNKHIIDLAYWAIAEYNKELKSSLALITVFSAAKQIGYGTTYYITLGASTIVSFPLPVTLTYEAVVWESSCSSSKKLLEFKRAPPSRPLA